MLLSARRWIVPAGLAVLATGVTFTHAEVLNVRGSASATVVEFAGVFPIQTDFNQEIVPITQSEPPVAARSKIDRLRTDGTTSAAGQALALFDAPNLSGPGAPNDAGLDLGAFSDDSLAGWLVQGAVNEVRTVQLFTKDIGTAVADGEVAKVRSRVLLSGVLIITGAKQGMDLSAASVNFSFSVALRQAGLPSSTPLVGELTFTGTPEGDARVDNPTGVLAGAFLPIVDFTDQIQDLPIVRALPFAGANFPYEYEIIVGQPFELELNVKAQVVSGPNGMGAAAVFGVPQDSLGAVLSRVKGSEPGTKLAEAVSRAVDTTGQAYANTPVDAPPPSAPLFAGCGVMNVEAIGLLSCCGLLSFARRGRIIWRRRRGRG